MDREKVIKGLESLRTRLLDVAMQDRIFVLDASMVANAIELLKEDCHNCKLECLLQKYDELKEKYDALLKERETVVRCMDCKFMGNTNLCPLAYIEKAEQFTALCTDEWFCGNGKRKEGR